MATVLPPCSRVIGYWDMNNDGKADMVYVKNVRTCSKGQENANYDEVRVGQFNKYTGEFSDDAGVVTLSKGKSFPKKVISVYPSAIGGQFSTNILSLSTYQTDQAVDFDADASVKVVDVDGDGRLDVIVGEVDDATGEKSVKVLFNVADRVYSENAAVSSARKK